MLFHRATGRRQPAALQRRGCRAVLAALLCTAAAQVALAAAVETNPALRDPAFGSRWQRLRQRRQAEPGRPLLLAVGTSRLEVGLRADLVRLPGDPLVFNFGLPGAGPPQQWLTLRRLRADGVRPDALLLELLP